jgi:biotin carboxyl carrier protein
MDEYRFLVNRSPFKIRLHDLTSAKTTFKAEVNGRSIVVELSEAVSPGKPFFIQVGGKPYHVELGEHEEGGLTAVKVNGASYVVQSENKSPKRALKSSTSTFAVERMPVKTLRLGRGVVAASMPGKVVLVRVKAGDSVRAGDVLLVLESMKMENEIISPIRGSVKEVRVSEGDAVNVGEVIVVIDET